MSAQRPDKPGAGRRESTAISLQVLHAFQHAAAAEPAPTYVQMEHCSRLLIADVTLPSGQRASAKWVDRLELVAPVVWTYQRSVLQFTRFVRVELRRVAAA